MASDRPNGASNPRRIALLVGCIAWIVAPLVGLGWLSYAAPTIDALGRAEEVWAPVRSAEATTTTAVDLVLDWQSAAPVSAPAWSGLTQTVEVVRGQTLHDGDALARIDGVLRLAAATPAPFYRDLSRGAVGEDVMWLNDFLTRRGYPSSPGSTEFTSSTARGVQALASAIGAGSTKAFSAAWVAWLPSEAFEVTRVELRAGALAPGAGTVVIDTSDELMRARPVALGSYSPPSTESADPTPVLREGTQLTIGVDEALVVGEVALALSSSRNEVAEEGISYLQTVVTNGQEVVQVQLQRKPGTGEVLVPSAAVFAGSSGAICVLRDRDGTKANVSVTVVLNADGQSVVTGDLKQADLVRIAVPSSDRKCE